MQFKQTAIPDVIIIELQVLADERGFFMETYQHREFHDHGIDVNFVQDNHSRSTRGVLRGLHYQIKNAQGKLVRVAAGEVFDVCVDLRRRSRNVRAMDRDQPIGGKKKANMDPSGFRPWILCIK